MTVARRSGVLAVPAARSSARTQLDVVYSIVLFFHSQKSGTVFLFIPGGHAEFSRFLESNPSIGSP